MDVRWQLRVMTIMALATLTGCAAESDSTTSAEPSLQTHPAQTIAEAYGIDGWDRVERIDFTFHVSPPGQEEPVVRQWSWWPKEGKATLQREGQESVELPLVRGTTSTPAGIQLSDEQVQAHQQFINDSYWLLFPFQIVWSNPEVTFEGQAPLPIGEGEGPKVLVAYPDEGGYTPGDAYTLYLDPRTHRIRQWTFHRGGVERNPEGSAMTWGRLVAVGPIIIATEHWGPPADEGGQGERFHLWFTDLRVKLVDQDEPVEPQPLR